MTTYKNELNIDIGKVSFRVRLDSSKLSDLIDDVARDGSMLHSYQL